MNYFSRIVMIQYLIHAFLRELRGKKGKTLCEYLNASGDNVAIFFCLLIFINKIRYVKPRGILKIYSVISLYNFLTKCWIFALKTLPWSHGSGNSIAIRKITYLIVIGTWFQGMMIKKTTDSLCKTKKLNIIEAFQIIMTMNDF